MRFGAMLAFLILMTGIFSGIHMSEAAVSESSTTQVPIQGDWIIGPGEVITLEGQSVEINGNVIIQPGGSLTLRSGSTLIINSSYDGEYGIYVKSGASFTVINSKVSGLERDYRGVISYDLNPGMNFISIPFERDNDSVENVLQTFSGRYYKAIVHDASDAEDPWKAYVPSNMSDYSLFEDEIQHFSWNITASAPPEEDLSPPSIYRTIPENGTVAETDQTIYCIFNESMDTSTVPTIRMLHGLVGGDFQFGGWRSIFQPNDTAIWTHSNWVPGDTIIIEIYGYRDESGNWGNTSNLEFFTESAGAPRVNKTSPSMYESDVPVDADLEVVFDTSMDITQIPEIESIGASNGVNWTFLGWASTYNPDDTAMWGHDDWNEKTDYTIRISNYTEKGGASGPDHYLFFTTEDATPPEVVRTFPAQKSSSVSPYSNVKVVFSESMNASVIPVIIQSAGSGGGNWTFLGWNSTYVENDTAVWSHDPWDDLQNIVLEITNYTDLGGNRGPVFSWSFKTGDHRLPRAIEVSPDIFSMPFTDAEIRVVFDSTMNTDKIPDIKDNLGTNYTFSGWESTNVEHDTAVWAHDNWSSDTEICISISNYSDLSYIHPTDGIFLYMKDNFNTTISGTVNAYPSRHLYEGWNALGYPFLDEVEAGPIFSSISGDYDDLMTYDRDGNEVHLNSTDTMFPGKAYWIHITDETLWSVSAYSLSDLENLFPRFGWVYENGSSGNIQNSLIAGCGYEEEGMGGLSIYSDLVKVSSSEFRNGFYGLYIEDASPIISSNTIHDSRYGIVSEMASPILSSNMVFSNTEGGIMAIKGFPIIASNDIHSNKGNGVSLYESTAILDSNTISTNSGPGLYLKNSSVSMSSQIIRNNDIGVFGTSSNISIYDSTFSGNFAGIKVSSSTVNISSTDFSLETYDMILSNGSRGNIIGNTMSSSERAHIVCENTSSPFIYGNILISGDTGIYINSASPAVENNIIGQNTGSGVQIQGSSGVNITSNTISGNGWAGIYMDSASALIEGNIIRSNDFGIASFGSSPLMVNNTVSSNRWYGASFVYSDALIENTDFIKNQWYGILSSYSTCEIRNSTIRNSTYQLYLTHNSRTTTVNSPINENTVHLDFSSVLYVKYFLNIVVEDRLGNGVSGAEYEITDRNGVSVWAGESSYGKAFYIPLTAYIRTYGGVTDTYNPYTVEISWNEETFSREFYMNGTTEMNFTFDALNYSIEEDSGETALFDTSEWFPPGDNLTYVVDQSPGVFCTVVNGTVYVIPEANWNGIALIRIHQIKDNRTLWNYTFMLNVIGVDDPPEILGESPIYTADETTVFTLTYRDIENEAPAYVRVVIDGKPHDMYPENMGDGNYVDGRTYVYRAPLSQGKHTYYFLVSDGTTSVRTEETTIDVRYTLDIMTYAIYFLIITGVFIMLVVAYRIRHLKKGVSDAEDEELAESPSPMILTGPALDKRRVIQTSDTGFDRPEDVRPLSPQSTIDHRTSEDKNEPAPPAVSAPMAEDTAVSGISDVEEQATLGISGAVPGQEIPAPVKEPKYSHRKYLEMTRKHRKMRVLVDDRDKYRLTPEPEAKEIPGPEDDVDDILRSIKGD